VVGAWPQPPRGLAHEKAVGDSVDWFTPAEFFAALGMTFAIDPCAGRDLVPARNVVPADRFLTAADDGLVRDWGSGRAFVNPPYGPLVPRFLGRLAAHGDGIALVYARTETRWAQTFMAAADAVVFMADRLYFVREDGYKGRAACGSMLLVYGSANIAPVATARLGWMVRR
jgi:hypothetical protein